MAFWLPMIRNFLSYSIELRHVLAEQRERRVGHDDVRLLEQLDALRAAEVAVALQRLDADLFGVGDVVAVLVAVVLKVDRPAPSRSG